MKAQDIMTREVATVRPETSVREIAGLMMEKNISGVPVVSDDGAIVGIVSEGDLLHRQRSERSASTSGGSSSSPTPTPLRVITPRPMVSRHGMSCPARSSQFAMMPI
jgi:CBS domain-containing protein